MAQTTDATMLFGLFWPSFGQMIRRRKKKKENLSPLDLSASTQVKSPSRQNKRISLRNLVIPVLLRPDSLDLGGGDDRARFHVLLNGS